MKLKYFCTIAEGFFKLPYRVVFAVATFNSLYVYDTESVAPILIHAGLHYAAITDISWSVLTLQRFFFSFGVFSIVYNRTRLIWQSYWN